MVLVSPLSICNVTSFCSKRKEQERKITNNNIHEKLQKIGKKKNEKVQNRAKNGGKKAQTNKLKNEKKNQEKKCDLVMMIYDII